MSINTPLIEIKKQHPHAALQQHALKNEKLTEKFHCEPFAFRSRI